MVGQQETVTNEEAQDIETIRRLFVDNVQFKHFVDGQCPARRAAFITMHGGAYGTFKINDEIDPRCVAGIFQPGKEYKVWVRFSSDVPYERSEKKSTIGIGIKLFNVSGVNILDNETWPGTGEIVGSSATNVDFTLQNYPVFFARDAKQMAAFKTAAVNGTLNEFLEIEDNKKLGTILDAMAQQVDSVLDSEYWSCIPFKLGNSRHCKYILTPSVLPPTSGVDTDTQFYMKDDLQNRISRGDTQFKFKIHLQNLPSQSLTDAQDDWLNANNEVDVKNQFDIATLTIPQQDISVRGQEEYSESLSYNPWRTLPEHEPVGSIADARRVVYLSSSHKRRDLNGQVVGEPTIPRSAALYPNGNPPVLDSDGNPVPNSTLPWPLGQPSMPKPQPSTGEGTEIVKVVIHPGIGIARVGNSIEAGNDMFIGPEVDTPEHMPNGAMRDNAGAIKRQAARFRLYGYNASGKVVKEITPDDANTLVEWSVHLANKKAQWFQFDRAFDQEDANDTIVKLRNAEEVDRDSLCIDAGLQKISGKDVNGVLLNEGKFRNIDVNLGELRTDDKGRLLVLGGMGVAESVENQPLLVDDPDVGDTFNNSNGWYDDISDGPVSASVVIDGKAIEVDSAWVIVAPPNYAPDIVSFRTLYDLLVDTYIQGGILTPPETVSFSEHILPSLQRLDNLKWVNRGYEHLFGVDGEYKFNAPETLSALSKKKGVDADADALKEKIFNNFHSPYSKDSDIHSWPLIYGDAFAIKSVSEQQIFDPADPKSSLSLSEAQYQYFKQWVDGNFVSDWDPDASIVQKLDDLPVSNQPAMLDKASLHFCLADTFHPGCEVTWPIRHMSLYRAPFRIKESAKNEQGEEINPSKTYPMGARLNKADALASEGPLYAQSAGDLTRWMGLPWHGDTIRCRAGYDSALLKDLPAFWPARVPNSVLTKADYDIFMNPQYTEQKRKDAYKRRHNWWSLVANSESHYRSDKEAYMQEMIEFFHKMYVVEAYPGPKDIQGYPDFVYVGTNIL